MIRSFHDLLSTRSWSISFRSHSSRPYPSRESGCGRSDLAGVKYFVILIVRLPGLHDVSAEEESRKCDVMIETFCTISEAR